MTPPSDPGAVPLGNWDEDVWASSSSSYHRRNFNTPGSLTDTVPIRSPQTLHRRRTSENANTASPTTVSGVVQHSRVESSDSVRGHPLGREADGDQHPSSFNDPTVTRPILNFWLSPAPAAGADTDPSEAEHEEGTDSGEKEELVLIHEVTTTDSLQGVSLKYGISMADLRKANQMWPSDSIHLRKSLNVPVNKARKLRNLKSQNIGSSSTATAPDVRRVPASRLSFFPQGSLPDVDTVVANTRRPRISGPSNSSNSRLSRISQTSNPSSIFSSLPRAFPISKDAIMSRLSFDSGGTPPTKGGQEHEMGLVGKDPKIRSRRRHRDMGTDSKTTSRTDEGLCDGKQTRSRNYDGYRIGGEDRERASTVVRTSQLEPSPGMLVPVLGQKRAKGEQRLDL